MLLLLMTTNTNAQTKAFTVSGKVTSFEESLALEGVNVRVKGTSISTNTLTDGTFSIDVPAGNPILIFELDGYEKQEVNIRNKKKIEVVLQRSDDNAGIMGYQRKFAQRMKRDIDSVTFSPGKGQVVINTR